jgi:hypothetical protein
MMQDTEGPTGDGGRETGERRSCNCFGTIQEKSNSIKPFAGAETAYVGGTRKMRDIYRGKRICSSIDI